MRQLAKRLVFGDGEGPRKVRFGVASGCRLIIDPAIKSQRILGLDEREIAGHFKRCIRQARTFIDVGASDGYYPIIGLWLNRDVTAIGCEPQEALERRARENYRLNFPEGGPVLEWVSSLIGTAPGQVPLDRVAEGRPGPCLVKIDVDGAEVHVLESGARLLDRPDTRVLLEVHSHALEAACIDLLKARGYTTRVIPNAWWRAIVPEQRPIELNRWVLAERASPA